MPQIYDMGPTALLPFEGRRAEDFFFALKNPTASKLGTKGQHATPRPPKPLFQIYKSRKVKVSGLFAHTKYVHITYLFYLKRKTLSHMTLEAKQFPFFFFF